MHLERLTWCAEDAQMAVGGNSFGKIGGGVMAQKAVASLRGMALPQQRRDSSSREPQTRRSHQFVDLTAASCRITGSTATVRASR